jgi:hypothetical protein
MRLLANDIHDRRRTNSGASSAEPERKREDSDRSRFDLPNGTARLSRPMRLLANDIHDRRCTNSGASSAEPERKREDVVLRASDAAKVHDIVR